MNIHFPHLSRHFFLWSSCSRTNYGLFVRIYLSISLFAMLPLNCLSRSQHFSRACSFHCILILLTPLSLRFILIYTPMLRNHTRTHSVCTTSPFPVSSNFLHTMLLFPLTSLPVVGYNLLLHRPVYYRYLRNLV